MHPCAASGDLGRLLWLRDRGCPLVRDWVLESALEHADLAVAQWLVDEAGCGLPGAAGNEWHWYSQLAACAKAPEGAAKLQWLRERGAWGQPQLERVTTAVAKGGHVEVLQYLLQQPGLRTERGLRELCKVRCPVRQHTSGGAPPATGRLCVHARSLPLRCTQRQCGHSPVAGGRGRVCPPRG